MKKIQSRQQTTHRDRSKRATQESEARKIIAEEKWAEVLLETTQQGGRKFPDFVTSGVLDRKDVLEVGVRDHAVLVENAWWSLVGGSVFEAGVWVFFL